MPDGALAVTARQNAASPHSNKHPKRGRAQDSSAKGAPHPIVSAKVIEKRALKAAGRALSVWR